MAGHISLKSLTSACMTPRLEWFALGVQPRQEEAVARSLRSRGLEEYVPIRSGRRRLFPGFVFCRFDYHRRLPVLITPGVTSIVGFGSDPVPVSESEIDDIKTILASGLPAQPWPFIRVGQPVRIECGSLAGLEGILLREKDTLRVVVQHRAAPPLRRRRDRSRRPVWPSTAQRMPKGPACISRLDFCVC